MESPEAVKGNHFQMCLDNYERKYPIGKKIVLCHLTTERGMALNGRRANIVGKDVMTKTNFNKCRLHVKLLSGPAGKPEGKPMRIKQTNIQVEALYTTVSSKSRIANKECLAQLNAMMKHHTSKGSFKEPKRQDMYYRGQFLRKYLPKTIPPPSKCMDTMVEGELGHFQKMYQSLALACIGDTTVDFRRFAEGLRGAGEDCSICLDAMEVGSQALTLPCRHSFHVSCGGEWLEKSNVCPTCRQALPNPWRTYLREVDRHIQIRMREWVVSGMCERCQMAYQEADPLMSVPLGDGSETCIPKSKLADYGITDNS